MKAAGTDTVEAPIRGYFEALNSADPDGIAAVFTEDGALLPDDGETVTGREAIRAMFRRHFAAISFQMVGTLQFIDFALVTEYAPR